MKSMVLWSLNLLLVAAAAMAFVISGYRIFASPTDASAWPEWSIWLIPLGLSFVGGALAGRLAGKVKDTTLAVVCVAAAWIALVYG
jgi:hypothetical protein